MDGGGSGDGDCGGPVVGTGPGRGDGRRDPSRRARRVGVRAAGRRGDARLRGPPHRGVRAAGRGPATDRRAGGSGRTAGGSGRRLHGQRPGGRGRVRGDLAGRGGGHPGGVPAQRGRTAARAGGLGRGRRGHLARAARPGGGGGRRGPGGAARHRRRGRAGRRWEHSALQGSRRGRAAPAGAAVRRRPRRADVHRRHDRPGEGRHAQPRQPVVVRALRVRTRPGHLRRQAEPHRAAAVARVRDDRDGRRDVHRGAARAVGADALVRAGRLAAARGRAPGRRRPAGALDARAAAAAAGGGARPVRAGVPQRAAPRRCRRRSGPSGSGGCRARSCWRATAAPSPER